MGILTKHEIEEYLQKGELIINPHKKDDNEYDIEPASYDLRAGRLIWKEYDPKRKKYKTCSKEYSPTKSLGNLTETIQPGQVMLVITLEEIKMPLNICGTVYAKNKFSRDGILAWTTGHVDPGIKCPIVIRLINLRATPYTIKLGEPVYTIVFHKLSIVDEKYYAKHKDISMEETVSNTLKAADSILGNALNDLSLTNTFIKREEFGTIFAKQFFKTVWGWIIIVAAILGTIASIVSIIGSIKN